MIKKKKYPDKENKNCQVLRERGMKIDRMKKK